MHPYARLRLGSEEASMSAVSRMNCRWMKALLLSLIMLMALGSPLGVRGQTKPVIQMYINTGSDITDWFQNTVVPHFKTAFPQYDVNLVDMGGSGNISDIATRALAALKAGKDPQVDIFINLDPADVPQETIDGNLWLKLDETNVPNFANVNPIANTEAWGMPYRGSQVLLADDSTKVKVDEVPTTFAKLVDWIKAHPGQFIYTRPDRGGTGQNFVQRAIFEANNQNFNIFTKDNYTPALADKLLMPAWKLLGELHPFMYEKGSYPASNTGSAQLLVNGSVSITTVWSDETIVGLNNGSIPPTIKVTQFTDLPMGGGYVWQAIPVNAANKDAALVFANYMLSLDNQVSVINDIGGFPAIKWELLPKDLQQRFN